ncbi:MAG: hypothetical protein Q7S51_07245 [Gallionellaceae bacterium]|nr:hypothetical protein [Gallionellaceae bacterium]
MTKTLNPDSSAFLPFDPKDLDRSGLRLTRAEFARFLEVSKQAVGEWVTAGKITLGADGRLDPRQAVSQLLRNSDPARLRSKVLAPLARDVGILQKRVAELERDLASANEDVDFHEGASLELIEQQDTLRQHLENDRAELANLPAVQVIAGLLAWLGQVASGVGDWQGLSILDCVPAVHADVSTGALQDSKEGTRVAPDCD